MVDIDMATSEVRRLIPEQGYFEEIASGLIFGEGPVWDRREGALYWTDIVGDVVWKWKRGVGREIVIKGSGKANGMTIDREGRLVVAGWGSRRIWRREQDGSIVTLASHYDGKKLNSPNDVVVKSDGSIYWTDSPGACFIPGMAGEDIQRYLDIQGVFRLSPDGKTVSLSAADCVYPNGLAFSHDEKRVYVTDTRVGLIRVYDVRPDGSLGPGSIFHEFAGSEPGVGDGIKVDVEGTIYSTGPGGIHILRPDGRLIGRIKIPGHHCTNLAWGDDDWKSLYMTTFPKVLKMRVAVPGVPV